MAGFQTITIFRNWVELAGELSTDSDRGKFYQALCEYSLDGTEPELNGMLKHFFLLIKPVIDKSNKRRNAQHTGVEKRLQNNLQTGLQNGLQDNAQTTTQKIAESNLQKAPRACEVRVRVEGREEKKTVPKGTAKEKKTFALLLPDHLQCSDVDAKWQEWEDYRRKKGKPISEAAARKQMKMLQDLSREEAIAAIDNSIANDYQGLFPPKQRKVIVLQRKKDYTGV